MITVLFGPAGSGKTTIGRLLAQRLSAGFADADDLHPPANIAKMSRGEALTDADRAPWLEAVADRVARASADDRPIVLACSALKRAYRAQLAAAAPGRVRFVGLAVPREVLIRRLAERRGHFAGPGLLDSQLRTFELPDWASEPPPNTLIIEADQSPNEVVSRIISAIGGG
ncbi:MAG: AAA family ATPase [Phycisphaerales bacterium]|nr:AAA family ATPase [Phycisphaerales bacterium]